MKAMEVYLSNEGISEIRSYELFFLFEMKNPLHPKVYKAIFEKNKQSYTVIYFQ